MQTAVTDLLTSMRRSDWGPDGEDEILEYRGMDRFAGNPNLDQPDDGDLAPSPEEICLDRGERWGDDIDPLDEYLHKGGDDAFLDGELGCSAKTRMTIRAFEDQECVRPTPINHTKCRAPRQPEHSWKYDGRHKVRLRRLGSSHPVLLSKTPLHSAVGKRRRQFTRPMRFFNGIFDR